MNSPCDVLFTRNEEDIESLQHRNLVYSIPSNRESESPLLVSIRSHVSYNTHKSTIESSSNSHISESESHEQQTFVSRTPSPVLHPMPNEFVDDIELPPSFQTPNDFQNITWVPIQIFQNTSSEHCLYQITGSDNLWMCIPAWGIVYDEFTNFQTQNMFNKI